MSEVREGQEPLEVVRASLSKLGWEPILLEDGRTYRVVYDGHHGEIFLYARIPKEVDVLVCFSLCPFDIPEDLLTPFATFVTRLNFGLRLGNFELNLDNGEFRYKNGLDFRRIGLSEGLVENVFLPCANAMDKYLPAIRAFVVEGKSATEAIALVESPEPGRGGD